MTALLPLLVWAVSYPATALAVLGGVALTLLLARHGATLAARRVGDSTAFSLPGLDARVEVNLRPDHDR